MSVETLEIQGMTLVEVVQKDDCVIFTTNENRHFTMEHEQNCCETVYLADVNGSWNDLLNTPLMVAEKRAEDKTTDHDWGETIWTFYTFRTVAGDVTLRWIGSHNGCYSAAVSFYESKSVGL